MHAIDSIESRIYEHVLGKGRPDGVVLNTGILSDEWTDIYLQLLKEAVQKYEGQDFLPRGVVAAVHFASWYLNIRYDAWSGFKGGKRIEKTDLNLARLRTPSEYLLLSGYIERAKNTLANNSLEPTATAPSASTSK